MAAELLALVYRFDNAFAARTMVEQGFHHKFVIDAYVDSNTVFQLVSRMQGTLEKRL